MEGVGIHFHAERMKRIIHGIQADCRLRYQQFCTIIFRKRGNGIPGCGMDSFGIGSAESVTGSFAPFWEGVCKSM